MAKLNINPGQGYTPIVPASQYDVGREIQLTIYDGSSQASIPSGAVATVVGTKPSGLGFTELATISGNVVTITTTATMTAEAGHIPAEVRLTYNGKNIGTANFILGVEASPHPEGTTDGDTDTARDLMTRANEAVREAEAAAAAAAESAQSAAESAEEAGESGIDASTAAAGQVPTANGSGGWSWADQTGSATSTSDDITNTSTVSGSTVTDALDSLYNDIDGLYAHTSDDIPNESTVTGSTVTAALNSLSGEIASKGTYSKPSGGIPKSDLASAVQTSLGKADTALQTAPVTSVNSRTGAVTGLQEETSIVTKTASNTSQTLAANTFYVWPAMTALTITCPTTGGPYAFRFTSGSTATTLTMSGITMPDDFTVEANKVYEINVYQGYGLAASWVVS